MNLLILHALTAFSTASSPSHGLGVPQIFHEPQRIWLTFEQCKSLNSKFKAHRVITLKCGKSDENSSLFIQNASQSYYNMDSVSVSEIDCLGFYSTFDTHEWVIFTRGFLADKQTLSQSLWLITHRHKIYRLTNELATLGSCLSHEQTRRLLSSTYGLWERTPWCEQITKMAQTQSRERILGLKTQHTRLKQPVPTNEPNLSLYRNERGTNITMHRPIIDTWQKIIVFG